MVKPTDRAEARDLHLLDRYLSLHGDRTFTDVAFGDDSYESMPRRTAFRGFRPAIAAFFIVGLVLISAMVGEPSAGRLAVSNLRGAPKQLEGTSVWPDNDHVALAWSAAEDATHYSLRVWDAHGGLITDRIVEGARTAATIKPRPNVPRPLLWTVAAWADTRPLAVSDVMITTPSQ